MDWDSQLRTLTFSPGEVALFITHVIGYHIGERTVRERCKDGSIAYVVTRESGQYRIPLGGFLLAYNVVVPDHLKPAFPYVNVSDYIASERRRSDPGLPFAGEDRRRIEAEIPVDHRNP